jgi:hypothetical protein
MTAEAEVRGTTCPTKPAGSAMSSSALSSLPKGLSSNGGFPIAQNVQKHAAKTLQTGR